MGRRRVQLAALIAASAGSLAAWGHDEARITLEQARLTRREALVRILDASGEDYVVGPGFEEPVALRLTRVPWSQALQSLLAPSEGFARGRIVVVGQHVAPRRWRVIPVPNSDPDDLARIGRGIVGEGGRSLADAEARLLILNATEEELDRVERLVAAVERPLPCPCTQGQAPARTRLTLTFPSRFSGQSVRSNSLYFL